MTTAICDPWIGRLIDTGDLPPAACLMTRSVAAEQYNDTHQLEPHDPEFLFTPDQAQHAAREVLATVGIETPPEVQIVLTDGHTGRRCGAHLVTSTQIEAGCEQLRQISGETIHPYALEGALPWA